MDIFIKKFKFYLYILKKLTSIFPQFVYNLFFLFKIKHLNETSIGKT